MAVAESWEDWADELEEASPPSSSSASQKATSSSSKEKGKNAKIKFPEEEAFLDDPVAERLRRQRLVEESEKRLVDDFFAGCDRPDPPPSSGPAETRGKTLIAAKAVKALTAASSDPLEAINLKTYKDCEKFVMQLSKKILESPAKSPAWLRLLDLLLKECTPKMDLKDLRTLQTKLNAAIEEKEKAERFLSEKKKKPNDLGSQCRNFREELDVVYGGDSEEEEEEDYEEDAADSFI